MTPSPTLDDVRRIADRRAPWSLTIYGDTSAWQRENHPTAAATDQIRSSVEALRTVGAPHEVIDDLRARLDLLAARSAGADGANPHSRSIAIFADASGIETFTFSAPSTPWVGVADRFLVAPLLAGAVPLVPVAFVAAISEKQVRLVDVSAHPAVEIRVPGLPRDFFSAIALDLTNDRDSLAHLKTSEDPKGRLREYSNLIDDAIEPVLRRNGALLIVAAAEPLASIFRSSIDYRLVAPSGIAGNHDDKPVAALAEQAAPIIDAHRRSMIESSLARFAEMPARDLVLTGIDDVAAASREGAIDTLLVDVQHRDDAADPAFADLVGIDRVDDIVRRAVSTGATIVPVRADDLPGPDPVAAVLRYPRPNTTRPTATRLTATRTSAHDDSRAESPAP